jgi:hypothetical protein
MAWHLQIGIDEKIMQKIDANDKNRQIDIFSLISIMIIVVSIIGFFASMIYLVIIFQNWVIGCIGAIIISLIFFNCYRFLIITSLNAESTSLASYHSNHEKQYEDLINNDGSYLCSLSETETIKLVNDRKEFLRINYLNTNTSKYKINSSFYTLLIRVFFISVFALIFATGIELFIFKNQINDILYTTAIKLQNEVPDSWLLKNVLNTQLQKQFVLFNSNSLLLLTDVLNAGLTSWKTLLDFIFLTLFLLPLLLIHFSDEIKKGSYLRELALHEISISFYHFLKTQQYCALLKNQIETRDLVKHFKSSVKNAK